MPTNWRQGLVEIESVIALLATYAGGFLPSLLLGVFALAEGSGHGKVPLCVMLVSFTAITAASAIWVARMAQAALVESCPRLARLLGEVGRTVRNYEEPVAPSSPLPLVMALRLPRIPLLLRPLVGLWWGGLFLGVAALGILVHDAMTEILKHAPLHQQLCCRSCCTWPCCSLPTYISCWRWLSSFATRPLTQGFGVGGSSSTWPWASGRWGWRCTGSLPAIGLIRL